MSSKKEFKRQKKLAQKYNRGEVSLSKVLKKCTTPKIKQKCQKN